MKTQLTRGDIVWVDLHGALGAEKMNGAGADGRTCLVVQNDKGNQVLQTTIVAPLTEANEHNSPVLVFHKGGIKGTGIAKDSVIDCAQIRAVDQSRVGKIFGRVSSDTMNKVCDAIARSVGCN